MEPSDPFAPLLAAAQSGDPHACSELWRRHAPAVVAFARARGSADPEDVTSEVFLTAFGKLAGFSGGEAAFRSFLFTVAHRRVVDELRARARRPAQAPWAAETDQRRSASAEDGAMVSLGRRGVVELLEGLAADQRDVLLLRVLGDLTVDQVAEVLGKRPGAVKALQRRGLDALRRQASRSGASPLVAHEEGE